MKCSECGQELPTARLVPGVLVSVNVDYPDNRVLYQGVIIGYKAVNPPRFYKSYSCGHEVDITGREWEQIQDKMPEDNGCPICAVRVKQ